MFLFNSFGWHTLKIFIDNNLNILADSSAVLSYINDICINQLNEIYPTIEIIIDDY